MKLRHLLLSAFLFTALAVQASEVNGIKCERDMRPVDGNYESIEVIKTDAGTFDVVFERKTAGFGFPVEETRVKIASNLSTCTFATEDGRIAACYKSASEESEPTNSGFVSTLVEKTAVNAGNGSLYKQADYALEIYSPLLTENAGQPGFPYMERPGFFTTSFRADRSQGGMLTGCVATTN